MASAAASDVVSRVSLPPVQQEVEKMMEDVTNHDCSFHEFVTFVRSEVYDSFMRQWIEYEDKDAKGIWEYINGSDKTANTILGNLLESVARFFMEGCIRETLLNWSPILRNCKAAIIRKTGITHEHPLDYKTAETSLDWAANAFEKAMQCEDPFLSAMDALYWLKEQPASPMMRSFLEWLVKCYQVDVLRSVRAFASNETMLPAVVRDLWRRYARLIPHPCVDNVNDRMGYRKIFNVPFIAPAKSSNALAQKHPRPIFLASPPDEDISDDDEAPTVCMKT